MGDLWPRAGKNLSKTCAARWACRHHGRGREQTAANRRPCPPRRLVLNVPLFKRLNLSQGATTARTPRASRLHLRNKFHFPPNPAPPKKRRRKRSPSPCAKNSTP